MAKAIAPDYALGPTRPRSDSPSTRQSVAERGGGAFVGQHGSWNRNPRSGYKVIFVPFANGMPSGKPKDVLTGFLDEKGEALGRRSAWDRQQGALLVADDSATPSGA